MSEQEDFDLKLFLPYLLNQAAEAASLDFQRVYKKRYGMLRTEWRVLFHLGIYGRLTARDISEKARIHKTKISRAVHRLSERRFLTRERDTLDRRSEHLELTVAGRTAYEDLLEVARTYEADLLAGFSPDEVRGLRKMLSVIARVER
ncbi:MAG: MarR family winged helix-turn-helix transcriptional regulator [Arenibacterium sp.]